ncbi:MAG: hypothetical protein ACTHXA_12105 [Gulosibacter sp.]|uniref:MinD/ParA family ATP-binding protein n=1 Tax=Gulosibacter sp. TaxID=2817531 RepID=UPI003F91C9BC
MAQEQTGRSLVALVRVDGHGELRDGSRITRMHAGSADELRGQLMERAIAIAVDEGHEIELTTIDVDGIYPLVCHPNGNLEQIGEVRPLGPGDIELTPERDETAADGGYADLFSGNQQSAEDRESLHETIQLPRPGMIAKHSEFEDHVPQDPDAEPVDYEDEPIRVDRAFVDQDDEEDLEEDLADEFHDEGLDHDFEDDEAAAGEAEADAAQQRDAFEPATDESAAEAERASEPAPFEPAPPESAQRESTHPDPAQSEQDEWRPNFTRGSRRQERQVPSAPPVPQLPATSGIAADEDEDLLSASVQAKHSTGRVAKPEAAGNVPTLDDFLASKSKQQHRPAEKGWRANLRRASGGLIKLGPGKQEQTVRTEMDQIQKVFDGTRTIVVVNPKGGAHKTTATLMIAAAFGTMRGGYTLAWDNNETRGTLGWRSRPGATTNTAVDLLRELPHFEISGGATISDIDRFVRNQGDAKFDVLASDDDAASAAIIDDDAFSRLHRVLSRFYRIMVIDTGNNMRASNWEAALDVADQLVIVSTAREDTAASAAWLADGLRERGYGDLLGNAVTILSSPSAKEDPELTRKLHSHFDQLTRAVVSVPYDQEFVGGGELNIPNLHPATREAWRHAAAVIAQGL